MTNPALRSSFVMLFAGFEESKVSKAQRKPLPTHEWLRLEEKRKRLSYMAETGKEPTND